MTLEDLYRLLRSGHVQAQGIVGTLTEPLLVLDEHLCVQGLNPAYLHTFRVEGTRSWAMTFSNHRRSAGVRSSSGACCWRSFRAHKQWWALR